MENLRRTPEPHELMDEIEQARAYAESDFTTPHNQYVERFGNLFPDFSGGLVLDVGVGHADPTIRFARRYPGARVLGIDGAEAMLSFGRKAVEEAGLTDRIELRQELLQENTFPPASFDAITANSLLHHLEDPVGLWRAIREAAKPSAAIYVVDLTRPQSIEEAQRLVELHSKGAPELMRRDFYNSLLAAFTPQEVSEQLSEAGIYTLAVNKVSDRHIVVHGRL
jgi:ubiquinone/menaquinone biosynthesis C-methylase UbiE